MGSAGAKAMAVLLGEGDAYVHSGGQYEWDSAAPVAVARAAGLHCSRIDGSPMVYNQANTLLPDLVDLPARAGRRRTRRVGLTADRRNKERSVSSIDYQLSQLDLLEAESIHIMREVAAEFERPGLLFSGGKDSIVMLRLAEKAFWPAKIPFPLMHVDTGHNFDEVIEYRDRRVAELGARLIVASVEDAIAEGLVVDPTGPGASRNSIQTVPLLKGIIDNKFDAVFGGARRDEEKARAKERVFSFRDEFGQWDPKAQRPELWSLYNGRHRKGEHIRIFPLSNWTELDIWQYVQREELELPSIYYAHKRPVFWRDNMLMAVTDVTPADEGAEVFETHGAVPHRRRHDLHRRRRVRRGHAGQDHRRRRRQPDHRAWRDPS